MGGQIALTLVVKHPGIARRVVLTGADFGGTHAVLSDAATVAILNNPNTTPEQFLNLLFPATAGQAEQAFVGQLAQVPQEATPVSATTRQGTAEAAWYRYEGTYKSLPSVKVPVVVTNGALDVVNPSANAKLIAKRLPKASVVIFAAGGHAMLFQNAARFAAIVNG
jgi:pimeloyl-ACP methyl ester carboxylesterase